MLTPLICFQAPSCVDAKCPRTNKYPVQVFHRILSSHKEAE